MITLDSSLNLALWQYRTSTNTTSRPSSHESDSATTYAWYAPTAQAALDLTYHTYVPIAVSVDLHYYLNASCDSACTQSRTVTLQPHTASIHLHDSTFTENFTVLCGTAQPCYTNAQQQLFTKVFTNCILLHM
jgi:hypothetical protein